MILVFLGFLRGGPYYDLIGRTGNNVGRRLRGKNVFSMRPAPSSKPATQPQINQRLKWTLVTSFFSWVTPVLNIGFKNYTSEMSGFNAAVQYNLLHAVTGVTPDYTLDYAKVLFSRGDLGNVDNPEAEAAALAKINVSWDSVVNLPYSDGTDRVSAVVYNPLKDRFLTLVKVVARSAEALVIQAPQEWTGDTVQLWLLTSDVKDEMVSTSIHLGALTLM